MKKSLAGAVVAALTALGCEGPVDGARCDDRPCPGDWLCDAPTQLCVRNEAPFIHFERPASNQVAPGHELLVSGRVEDDEQQVASAEWAVGDEDVWSPLPLNQDRFELRLPVPELDHQALAFRVRATDGRGHRREAQHPVWVDNVAPTCRAASPAPAEVVGGTAGEPFPLEFAIEDGAPSVEAAEISVDGADFREAEVQDKRARLAWALPAENGGIPHRAQVRARDRFGRPCTAEVAFRVDTFAPKLDLEAPAQSERVGLLDTLRVEGTASDEGAPVRVEVTLDGTPPLVAELADNRWVATPPLPKDDFRNRTLTVVARDRGGNTVTVQRTLWVDRVAPALEVTSPSADRPYTQETLGPQGGIPLVWSAYDGDAKGLRVEWQPAADAPWQPAPSTPVLLPTTESDDGRAYTVSMRATDSIGHQVVVTRTYSVDRRNPTLVKLDPADQTRNQPPRVRVTFSEPMVAADDAWLTVTPRPPQPGRWVEPAVYEVDHLSPDTAYTAELSVGALRDRAGNPLVAGARATFHTEVARPSTVVVLAKGVTQFAAASDPDGVLLVVTPDQAWRFDPQTGLPTPWPLPSGPGNPGPPDFAVHQLLAQAWSRPVSSAVSAAERVFGFTRRGRYPAPGQGDIPLTVSTWRTGDLAAQLSNDVEAVIPTPSACAEPAGTASWALLDKGLYTRPGVSQTYPVTLDAPDVVLYGEDFWFLAETSNNNLFIQSLACRCDGVPTCQVFPASLRGRVPFATNLHVFPRLSAAATTSGTTLWVYDDNGSASQRVELCRLPCPTGQQCRDAPRRSGPTAQGLMVAPRHLGEKVLGARREGPRIELVERDLTHCLGAWTPLTGIHTDAVLYQPVLIGARAGLVFVEGTDRTLKVFAP